MIGIPDAGLSELVKCRYSTDLQRDSRIADVVVRPGLPTNPQERRTSEHEQRGYQAERLGVQSAISHNPTLGHRIRFVYRTSGWWLSQVDAERPGGQSVCAARTRLSTWVTTCWSTH